MAENQTLQELLDAGRQAYKAGVNRVAESDAASGVLQELLDAGRQSYLSRKAQGTVYTKPGYLHGTEDPASVADPAKLTIPTKKPSVAEDGSTPSGVPGFPSGKRPSVLSESGALDAAGRQAQMMGGRIPSASTATLGSFLETPKGQLAQLTAYWDQRVADAQKRYDEATEAVRLYAEASPSEVRERKAEYDRLYAETQSVGDMDLDEWRALQATPEYQAKLARMEELVGGQKEATMRKAEQELRQMQDDRTYALSWYGLNALDAETRAAVEQYANLMSSGRDLRSSRVLQELEWCLAQFKKSGLTDEQINAYWRTWERYQNQEKAADLEGSAREFTTTIPGLTHTIANIGAVGAKLYGGITGTGQALMQALDFRSPYKNADPNAAGFAPGIWADAVRTQTSEDIVGDGTKGWRKAANLVYNGTVSAADNLARLGIGILTGTPGVTLALAGTSTFEGTYRSATNAGASTGQALLMGIVDAGIEVLTEKMNIDSIFSKFGPNASPASLTGFLKTYASELTEEEISFFGSMLAESFILREKSNFNQAVAQLVAEGMDETQAQNEVWRDIMLQACLELPVSVGISSGIMTGSSALFQSAQARAATNQNTGNVDPSSTLEIPKLTDADILDATIAGENVGAADTAEAAVQEAVESFRNTGKVSNNLATRILQTPGAVEYLQQNAALTLPGTAAGNRAAVKDAVASLAAPPVEADINQLPEIDDAHIKEQIRQNQERLNGAEPVADIKIPSNYFEMDRAAKLKWIESKLRPTGFSVDREGFGIIDFAKKRFKKAIRYFKKGSIEDAAFEAIPYVLKHGEEITLHDDHKSRQYSTVTFAAPVLFNGRRGNMAVVVKQTNGNHYKVHRILTPDGSVFVLPEVQNEAEPTTAGESPETGSLATPKGSASLESSVVGNGAGHRHAPPLVPPSENIIHQNQAVVNHSGDTMSGNISVTETGAPADSSGVVSVGAAEQGFDPYSTLQYEHGNKPDRPGTVRDINVPKRDTYNRRVSDMAANLYGNSVTNDEMVKSIEDLVVQGYLGADVKHNLDTLENAIQRIKEKGYSRVRDGIVSAVEKGVSSDDLLAEALALYTYYQASGNITDAADMVVYITELTRTAARTLNIAKLTSKLTPDGQYLSRMKLAENGRRSEARRRKKQVEDIPEITISEATEKGFKEVATAAETIVTDAKHTLDQALSSDISAAVSHAVEAGVKAGDNAASSALRAASGKAPTPDQLYAAIMEFVNSKKQKLGGKAKRTKALDALVQYYSNRDEFGEAWEIARRRAELAVQDDPKAYGILRQFLDTGLEAQDVMDTQDSGSVSRKAVRQAADAADVKLGELLTKSLQDKTAAFEQIRSYVASQYDLSAEAADAMAIQLQESFFEELSRRQTGRLMSMFSQKSEAVRKTTMERFRELYNLGAFQKGSHAFINREALKRLFGHDGLVLSQELMDEYGQISEARKAEMDRRIFQEIADQLPPDWKEARKNLRYTGMLLNPSTHLKNIAGNTAQFVIQYGMKDNLAALIETGLDAMGVKIDRTKAILNPASQEDRDLVALGIADYGHIKDNNGDVASRIQNGSRYDDAMSEIQKRRRHMKVRGKGKVAAAVNTALGGVEWLGDANSNLMNLEDAFFGRNAYALSLASYMKANHLTEITEDARAYAIAQAQEATFHDISFIYQKLKDAGVKSNIVTPFVKTPANVTARALEYSPAEVIQVVSDVYHMIKGDEGYTASRVINDSSKAIIGTIGWRIGWWLASQGLIRVIGVGSKKKREYEEKMGQKNFSIMIGGKPYDPLFLSPAIIPFLCGAALYESITNAQTGNTEEWDALEALGYIAEPVLETSMLSGLSGIIYAIRTMDDTDISSAIGAVGTELITSYLNQYVPAFLRRIAYAADNTSRSSGNMAEDLMAGVHGLRQNLDPVRDPWGQVFKYDASGGDDPLSVAWRTVNPARQFDVHKTDIDDEITRLLDLDLPAYPTAKNSSTITVSTIDENGDEHSQKISLTKAQQDLYERVEGEASYALAEMIIGSDLYRELPDYWKSKALQLAYEHANNLGKEAALSDYTYELPGYLSDKGITEKAAQEILAQTYQNWSGLGDKAYERAGEFGFTEAQCAQVDLAVERYKNLHPEGTDNDKYRAIIGHVDEKDRDKWLRVYGMSESAIEEMSEAAKVDISAEGYIDLMDYRAEHKGFSIGTHIEMMKCGVSDATAKAIQETFTGLSPEVKDSKTGETYTSVRNIQKLEAIVGKSGLSSSDEEKAVRAILEDEKAEPKLDKVLSMKDNRGSRLTAEDYVAAYRASLDTSGTGRKQTIIQTYMKDLGVTKATAEALYDLFN